MTVKGSCLCGAVRYEISGPLRDVISCHCQQCRKTSGHFVAATQCRRSDLNLQGDTIGLKWYPSSAKAKRGFCGQCGASLFWTESGSDLISVMAGTLDGASGLTTSHHIYVSDKGDYYTITDSLPQHAQSTKTA